MVKWYIKSSHKEQKNILYIKQLRTKDEDASILSILQKHFDWTVEKCRA